MINLVFKMESKSHIFTGVQGHGKAVPVLTKTVRATEETVVSETPGK